MMDGVTGFTAPDAFSDDENASWQIDFAKIRALQRINAVPLEYTIARSARDACSFSGNLFTIRRAAVRPDFNALRTFALALNRPGRQVRAGDITAMGLINELLHLIISHYRAQYVAAVLDTCLAWLNERFGEAVVGRTLERFTAYFPPQHVYAGAATEQTYLTSAGADMHNTRRALETMLIIALANDNPAYARYRDVFDDAALARETPYRDIIAAIEAFFATQPPLPGNRTLTDALREPARRAPHSLEAQLRFMLETWAALLPESLHGWILQTLDIIREDAKFGRFGIGRQQAPSFDDAAYAEPEQFSADRDWMPRIVMLAKNTHVWLYQLSHKYHREITRLDQIPDEELDCLSRWGFTGLWLIGLWERSPASKRIKQLCGNPDAASSAYSLYDYVIADELGGEQAFQNLKHRAWQRGIRLAGDMVPNHMGIYSKWVIERPELFMQVRHPPFPSYQFTGENLSLDSRVALYIEDKYWCRSDAAVVFKRVDTWTGDVRYIYHGNDGTTMPWNDTAQLDFLKAETREAVIQTILHVAKNFPIIRFDAAMTLAKQHFQRLWYPKPGTGGDIPSRAEHAMARTRFDELFPVEFWREVVDRVAAEAPDTLLLAEAFWLLEGYFVRTLGMHRVYNSAFMNMLKTEDNAGYRQTIRNILEFDPEILRRFVNFMSNPDELTAQEQFGDGDKYFGVALMMVTMPGLPMFGHGQVEGFTEKYGMEYRRPYCDEKTNGALLHRHESTLFPLMRRRHLFSGVEHFTLFDFYRADGTVDENVFAYSNRHGDERALVVYQNSYAETAGWIRDSSAMAEKNGEEKTLTRKNLGRALDLHRDDGYFCIFRDYTGQVEYIRSSREVCDNGLYIQLGAYQYHVFLHFHERQDDSEKSLAYLAASLNGRGVSSVDEALKEHRLAPLLSAYGAIINTDMVRKLARARSKTSVTLKALFTNMLDLLETYGYFRDTSANPQALIRRQRALIDSFLLLHKKEALKTHAPYRKVNAELKELRRRYPGNGTPYPFYGIFFSWTVLRALAGAEQSRAPEAHAGEWIDSQLFGKYTARMFAGLNLSEGEASRITDLVKILVLHPSPSKRLSKKALAAWLTGIFADPQAQHYLEFNRFEGTLYFNRERFEEVIAWYGFIAALERIAFSKHKTLPEQELAKLTTFRKTAVENAAACGYRSEEFLKTLLP